MQTSTSVDHAKPSIASRRGWRIRRTAAASLPDETHGPVDLREYYAKNRRYFWSLITVFQFGYSVFGIYFVSSYVGRLPYWVGARVWAQMIAPLAISVALLLLRSRLAHYVGLALMFVVMVFHYARVQIN